MDLKTKLMELAQLKPQKIKLKSVDLEIYIKPISFKDRYEIEKLEQTEPLQAMAKLISSTVCDEAGGNMFDMKEAEQLCDGRADYILEIVENIYQAHFVEDKDLEDEAKK